ISSMKKWGTTRLPMNRPCRSVNMHRTVSTSPSSTRLSSSFSVSVPLCMKPPPQVGRGAASRRPSSIASVPKPCPPRPATLGLNLLHVGLPVPLLLRVAVLALRQCEFLLGRQDQTVPPRDREVEEAEQEIRQRAVDARPVVAVRV